jgi:hypothetical protein
MHSDFYWYDVSINSQQTGYIYLENNGHKDSSLDWEIDESYDWISSTPEDGEGLKPSDGKKQIFVNVKASGDYETARSGTFTIKNSDDPSDKETFDVFIETAEKKAKSKSIFDYSFGRFPFLKHIFTLFFS